MTTIRSARLLVAVDVVVVLVGLGAFWLAVVAGGGMWLDLLAVGVGSVAFGYVFAGWLERMRRFIARGRDRSAGAPSAWWSEPGADRADDAMDRPQDRSAP